jgi:hypothetical protein
MTQPHPMGEGEQHFRRQIRELLPKSRNERAETLIKRIGMLLSVATFGKCRAGLDVTANRRPSGVDHRPKAAFVHCVSGGL